MTNWSGSLTFDDKIFGNRRCEQVFGLGHGYYQMLICVVYI